MDLIVKCKDCGLDKKLAAYGICVDCFKSTERFGGHHKLERQADGTPLCRFCKRPVAKPRRTFCSDACVSEWQIRSNVQYARAQVFLRDKGICALCGLDTLELEREMLELQAKDPAEWARQWDELIAAGWDRHRRLSLWENDHIKPVIEGGGLCGLDNYRTLCIPCHALETAKLRVRMADRKAIDGQQD